MTLTPAARSSMRPPTSPDQCPAPRNGAARRRLGLGFAPSGSALTRGSAAHQLLALSPRDMCPGEPLQCLEPFPDALPSVRQTRGKGLLSQTT
jgi:hypothetical protein